MGANAMSFWVCNYHVVWATKGREPMITPSIEGVIFESIRQKSIELKASILAVNGVEDHVHVAVQIPPKVSVSQWVRHVKGFSTREVNTMYPDLPISFRWQTGFGVLTFGSKQTPFVVGYIERQKAHHANNTIEPYLERIGEDDSD